MEKQPSAYLQVRNVSKRYRRKGKIILQQIQFEANAGSCVGILGHNGCGKSTLLSVLAGFLPADSGTLVLRSDEYSLRTGKPLPKIGYVPQENPLIGELSALDNLRLWYCCSELKLEEQLKEGVLAMLGIPEFLHTPVNRMSGGMKKRLSIGCSVANEPDLLLLDEPGNALDLLGKQYIQQYIQSCQSQNKIVIMTTHDEAEIALCDKLYILKDGTLSPYEYDGDAQKLTESMR